MDHLECKLKGNYIIRYARKEDCKNLLLLIQELADCLDSSDEPRINVSTLEKYGFDTDSPLYKCLVVEDLSSVHVNNENRLLTKEMADERKNPLVAYALFSVSFSSWYGKGLYLEDIYTNKAHRGKGFGTALFRNIAKVALDLQCSNMTLFVFKTNDMKDFFISQGAKNLTESSGFDYYKIDKDSMIHIANK